MALIEATDKDFDELIQTEYAVVDFYGDHCGACTFTAPYFREAADDMAFIRFIKVNTSRYPELAKRFDIKGIPAFFYFYNGEVVHKSVGGMTTKEIRKQVAAMLYREKVQPKEKRALEGGNPEPTNNRKKVRLNDNPDVVKAIREGLKKRGGYCPCSTEISEDTKCMCKEFREQIADPEFEGYCHCMLYYKER